jgi:hypothetical protein
MGTITALYIVAFSCFPHRVSGVFAQTFVIYIFKFLPMGFSKIEFILCDVMCSRGSVTTQMLSDHLSPTSSRQQPCRRVAWRAPLPNCRARMPSRTHWVAVTHVYKKGMNGWEEEVQVSTLSLVFYS